MKILKKAAITFLVLISTLTIFMIVPLYNENYGNTVHAANVSDGGVPLYQANVIANGYNNDGDSHYNLFKSIQAPVYYELTDYMLEDNILCWTSNFWNSAFNSEFQKNPSYFYEVMLMGYLKYEQKEINTSGVWNSKEMSLATKIYKSLADKLIDFGEEPNYKEFLDQVKHMSNDELKGMLQNIDGIKLSSEVLDKLSKGLNYGTEFIDAIAEYECLLDAKSERIELLRIARAKVTDNEYFTKAVDDIIEKMEKTPIEYVSGEMLDKLWGDFLDAAWGLIVEGSPIATVLKAIDIEKMTLDVLFNSSDTASNNFKLLVLYIVDTYFDSALEQSLQNYNSVSSVSNGTTLIQCYKGYIEYQLYGLDYTKTFINDIVDSGPIHHIVEQIFFQESIKSAEELTQLCDSQISIRQKLLELLEKSVDIYYKETGLNELVHALNETEVQNIPVTSVSFKQSEIILESTKDICLISADVFPENATNQKVTYTCSDSSILSVPENGGFATQKSEGTVTVTATTEDGGFTATQTITVKYVPELKREYHGKCGNNLYWTLYSNGTIYITGSGDMNNWRMYNSPPWSSVSRKIKSVIIEEGVTSVGKVAFYNYEGQYSALEYVRLPNSLIKMEIDAFRCCYQLRTAGPVGGGFDIEFTGEKAAGLIGYFPELREVFVSDNSIMKAIENLSFVTGDEYYGALTAITLCDNVDDFDVQILSQRHEELKNIFVGHESGKYKALDGILYSADGSVLYWYPRAKETEQQNFDIPDSVSIIEKSAFAFGTLKSITIPESVTEIKDCAFYNCTNLLNVIIPKSVIKMDGCGLGLISHEDSDEIIEEFVIQGYVGSAAEAYAQKHGLKFIAIDGTIEPTIQETEQNPTVKPTAQEIKQNPTVKPIEPITQSTNVKKPSATKTSKIKKGRKSLKISWKKVRNVNGYQIQYSTSRKFKKARKITIKNGKATSKTIKKLQAKKKYYVRIRTYVTVNGKTKYSNWSKTKSQKTK